MDARLAGAADTRPEVTGRVPVRPHVPGKRRFRRDVEGMRAVAILGVVLYHAQSVTGHTGILGGGYVGVDVFFVVSGYLITGLLWTELEARGRISFASFYGRRARRLLPAAMLTVVVTALAARRWMPPLQVGSVLKDGLASALYVGNYRFAVNGTSYLSASAPPSPFQHFWSLGVEEQFYLLWPLLLVGATVAWRRRGRYRATRRGARAHQGVVGPGRSSAFGCLAALTAASFLLSLWLTHADEPWAFFSLPTRAWELGVGGMLALAAPVVRRCPAQAAAVLGWAGLATTITAMCVITGSTAFPGTAAVVPALGTVAVLAAGEALAGRPAAGSGPARVLGTRPMRMVGRISYSWYLWHWPFLILAPYALGHPLAFWQDVVTALLSGFMAVGSFLLVENPARTSRWLAAWPRRSLVTGGSLTAGGVAACVLLALTTPSLHGHGLAQVEAISAPGRLPGSHRYTPQATIDLLQAKVAAITAEVNAEVAASLGERDVPANLTPTLSGASSDEAPVFFDGCMDSYLSTAVDSCTFGDLDSSTGVVLFGDSHAAMWFPAVDEAANADRWRLYNWTKATCPPLYGVPMISPVLGRDFTECEDWRQDVLARIQQVHPALVILGLARHYTSIYGFTPYQPAWLDGLSQMVSVIRRMGIRVAVIGPVPKPPFVVPDCLSAHLDDAYLCTEPEAQVVNNAGMAAEQAAVARAGGTYVDVIPWFCTSACTAMVGNIEVWRDDNHIDATYSNYLGPAMSAELQLALSRA